MPAFAGMTGAGDCPQGGSSAWVPAFAGMTGAGGGWARARQNVLFELGYFAGKLGRDRVCALHAEGVEVPSDLAGVVRIALDAHDGWKMKVGKELTAAGFAIDLNRLS